MDKGSKGYLVGADSSAHAKKLVDEALNLVVRVSFERFLLDDNATIEGQVISSLSAGEITLLHEDVDILDPLQD